jgi:signal transduction histidine kinase
MVGHDIRNPLQAIVSELFLASQAMEEVPEDRIKTDALESIANVQEQVEYINKIVSDLQDFAKPLKPELKEVDLREFIASFIGTIKIPPNVTPEIQIQENLKMKTDPVFIRRSITNLVNNAVQAMPNGGKLEITGFRKGQHVVVCVSDTGVGIPEYVKPRLFTPMMTTKAKGQGLGLAVVKRLIEALGGKISFESQERKGTKFTIELPT